MKHKTISISLLSILMTSGLCLGNLFVAGQAMASVDFQLAQFKKQQKRIGSDTQKRSTLHRINRLRKSKKKRQHYKKDTIRTKDKRNPASDREIHPRFSQKGLSQEKIDYYLQRYEERQRLRDTYGKKSTAVENP